MQGPDADIPSLAARLRRAIAWLIALPLLGLLVYLAGINWLLDTAWLQARLTPQPGLTINWQGSHSLWPGRLMVESLRLRREDDDLPLDLAVDSATLDLSLVALFSRRLEIRSLEAEGLRSLVIGEHELRGEGGLRLAGLTLEEKRVGVDVLKLSLEKASLQRGDALLAGDIGLDANLEVTPFVPGEHPGISALRFLTGELAVEARADAWDLFTPYLGQLEGLVLAGNGRLDGWLLLDGGRLERGSRLTLDSPALEVTLDESALFAGDEGEANGAGPEASRESRLRLGGSGRVSAQVDKDDDGLPLSRLEVELDDLRMHRGEETTPFLTGRHFVLAATLPPADLARPPRALESASLRWEDAQVPDVRTLARYLPDTTAFALLGGRAGLDGRLDYADESLDGHFLLEGEDVDLRLLEQRVSGALRLDLNLTALDPLARTLDLSGTRLGVEVASVGEALPLSLDLVLHEAQLAAPSGEGPMTPLDGRLAVKGRLDRLGFLDPFLAKALDGRGISLAGGGDFTARLALEAGRLAPGSRLAVESEEVAVRLLDFRAGGRGRLSADWQEDEEGSIARFRATFDEAGVQRFSDESRLLEGARLVLDAEVRPPAAGELPGADALELTWEDARLPDVAVLGHYLPADAPFALDRGSANSRGRLRITGDSASGSLELVGRAITGRLFDEAIGGELSLDLNLAEARLDASLLDVSGTRLELQAAAADTDATQRLQSLLIARQARFFHPLSADQRRSGQLVLEGKVSRLGFLDAFLPQAHGLAIRGNGLLDADLRLQGTTLLPGSRLRIDADELSARFLDQEARGRGRLTATIDGEAADPGASLRLELPAFSLSRQGETRAGLEGRHFSLETSTPRLRLGEGAMAVEDFTTRVALPIVEIGDIGRYNGYLPDDAGLELVAGRASLETELILDGMTVQGDLTLQAFDTALRLADQRLRGDLRLEVRLREGDLAERRFDASGSMLRLDNVSRQDEAGARDAGWWARLDLDEGQLVWQRPLRLDSRIGLSMRDSGLLARLFLAGAREREWLGRLLTVQGIRGEARIRMDNDSIRLQQARLEGGDLRLLADLTLRDETLDGSLYARLGALGVGVDLVEGETRLRFLRPGRWYDRRHPGPDEGLVEVPPEEWRESLE
jgi:hypothetical protein